MTHLYNNKPAAEILTNIETNTNLVGNKVNDNFFSTSSGTLNLAVREDNFFNLQQKIQPEDTNEQGIYGISLDIFEDKLVVAASHSSAGLFTKVGSVYFYSYSVSTDSFTLIQKIKPLNSQNNLIFGHSINLYKNYLLVGAPGFNNFRGKCNLYTYSNNKFSLSQELIASDGISNDFFGGAVKIYNTSILVSSSGLPTVDPYFEIPIDFVLAKSINNINSSEPKNGCVYVFTLINNSFIQTQIISPDFGNPTVIEGYDLFGISLDIFKNTAIIYSCSLDSRIDSGTSKTREFSNNKLFIFNKTGDKWLQLTNDKFTNINLPISSKNILPSFYGSKPLKIYENTIVVSTIQTNSISDNDKSSYSRELQGIVYIYNKNKDNTWSFFQRIIDENNSTSSSFFGTTVDIYKNILIIGNIGIGPNTDVMTGGTGKNAYLPYGSTTNPEQQLLIDGGIYIYNFNGKNWIKNQFIKLLPEIQSSGTWYFYNKIFEDKLIIGGINDYNINITNGGSGYKDGEYFTIFIDKDFSHIGSTIGVPIQTKRPYIGCVKSQEDGVVKEIYIVQTFINNINNYFGFPDISGNFSVEGKIYDIVGNEIVFSHDGTGNEFGYSNIWISNSFHTLKINDKVQFKTVGAGASGYVIDTNYFVVNVISSNIIQLSDTLKGSPLVTNDSTGTWKLERVGGTGLTGTISRTGSIKYYRKNKTYDNLKVNNIGALVVSDSVLKHTPETDNDLGNIPLSLKCDYTDELNIQNKNYIPFQSNNYGHLQISNMSRKDTDSFNLINVLHPDDIELYKFSSGFYDNFGDFQMTKVRQPAIFSKDNAMDIYKNYIVVGAPFLDTTLGMHGVVYIFKKQGKNFKKIKTINARYDLKNGKNLYNFGCSVKFDEYLNLYVGSSNYSDIPLFEIGSCLYNNSTTINTFDDTSKLIIGMNVAGDGIQNGTTISSITNTEEFEISLPSTGGFKNGKILYFYSTNTDGAFSIFTYENDNWIFDSTKTYQDPFDKPVGGNWTYSSVSKAWTTSISHNLKHGDKIRFVTNGGGAIGYNTGTTYYVILNVFADSNDSVSLSSSFDGDFVNAISSSTGNWKAVKTIESHINQKPNGTIFSGHNQKFGHCIATTGRQVLVSAPEGDNFSFTDSTCDTNNSAGSGTTFGNNPKIIQIDNTEKLIVGMGVSGTGIQFFTIITEILSTTLFKISKNVTATNNNITLTFGTCHKGTSITSTGFVYCYGFNNNNFTIQQEIKATKLEDSSGILFYGATNSRVGQLIKTYKDIVILSEITFNSNTGAAYMYIFENSSINDIHSKYHTCGKWTQKNKGNILFLQDSEQNIGDKFSKGIAIYGDWMMFGSPGFNSNSGKVCIFKKTINNNISPVTFSYIQNTLSGGISLVPKFSVGINDNFGNSIDMFNNILVIGAPGDGTTIGKVYIYKYLINQDLWNEILFLKNENYNTNEFFGNTVKIYDDIIIVSAYGHNNDMGCVYVYKQNYDYTNTKVDSENRLLTSSSGTERVIRRPEKKLQVTGSTNELDGTFGKHIDALSYTNNSIDIQLPYEPGKTFKDITIFGYLSNSSAKLHFSVGTTNIVTSHIIMADFASLTNNTIIDSTCDTDNSAGSGTTFGNNPKIIQIDSTSLLKIGMLVSGTGIQANSKITQIDSDTLFRVNLDTIASNSNVTLSFTNYHFVHSLKDCPFQYVSIYNSDVNDTGDTLLQYIISTH